MAGSPVHAVEGNSGQSSDILLACSFDGTVQPEIQKGDKGFRTSAPPEYVKGFQGKALVTGHARNVVFPAAGNLDLNRGTIKLWVMPIDWKVGDNLFHHFFRVLETGSPAKDVRAFDLLLYKFLDIDAVLAFGMAGELTSANILQIPMEASWKPNRWHQIAFTWDREGAALYVDGQGKTQKYLRGPPDRLTAGQLIVGGAYFAENKTRTAIDELTIYGRKLTSHEIDQLYKTELIESAMRRYPNSK
jgi:hypothetical protein